MLKVDIPQYTGLILCIPLLYEYLKSIGFRPSAIRLDIASIALIPMGMAAFYAYVYYLTGDFLGYMHIRQTGWGRHLNEPLSGLLLNMLSHDPALHLGAWFTVACIALLVAHPVVAAPGLFHVPMDEPVPLFHMNGRPAKPIWR